MTPYETDKRFHSGLLLVWITSGSQRKMGLARSRENVWEMSGKFMDPGNCITWT